MCVCKEPYYNIPKAIININDESYIYTFLYTHRVKYLSVVSCLYSYRYLLYLEKCYTHTVYANCVLFLYNAVYG